MKNTIIAKSVIFTASRETVWAFLTESEKLGEWFYPAEADLVVGEEYALMGKTDDGTPSKTCWGTVLEMDPPSRLVYTFTIKPMGDTQTTVTWTLEDVEGGTKLSLLHEGIDAKTAMGLLVALDGGWDRHLASLRSAVTS